MQFTKNLPIIGFKLTLSIFGTNKLRFPKRNLKDGDRIGFLLICSPNRLAFVQSVGTIGTQAKRISATFYDVSKCNDKKMLIVILIYHQIEKFSWVILFFFDEFMMIISSFYSKNVRNDTAVYTRIYILNEPIFFAV